MAKLCVATGQRRLFLGLFFGGWQNIKKRGVFAAARLDVGSFSYYLFITFFVIILDCESYKFGIVISLSSMLVGYFRFQLEGNGMSERIGYFNLMEGHQFYSVWLFSFVQKVTDRNDPAYVVDKPQLRYVPEVLLECFRTYAVDFNTPRWPVYVIHRSYFVDESVAFRHGMAGIYYIENKAMVVDVVIPVDRGDFPRSSLDLSMSEGVIDENVIGFLDITFFLVGIPSQSAP